MEKVGLLVCCLHAHAVFGHQPLDMHMGGGSKNTDTTAIVDGDALMLMQADRTQVTTTTATAPTTTSTELGSLSPCQFLRRASWRLRCASAGAAAKSPSGTTTFSEGALGELLRASARRKKRQSQRWILPPVSPDSNSVIGQPVEWETCPQPDYNNNNNINNNSNYDNNYNNSNYNNYNNYNKNNNYNKKKTATTTTTPVHIQRSWQLMGLPFRGTRALSIPPRELPTIITITRSTITSTTITITRSTITTTTITIIPRTRTTIPPRESRTLYLKVSIRG
ncbi:unnamed protein product [Polarella glacialis]|uniref:Uncharacterized protein n=1 Tax=Polarella glacialis TaxID=89957 RepID=A0A813EQC1_POLGL|nr:unnamed protein product [Polarella glacialis]